MTRVSYDGTGVTMALVSYDGPGCHGTPPPCPVMSEIVKRACAAAPAGKIQ